MSPTLRERLFGVEAPFEQPLTLAVALALAGLLLVTPIIIHMLARRGVVDDKLKGELILRYKSWLVLTPLIVLPILLGPAWTILGVAALSLLCHREFARATGLFREQSISVMVVLGILGLTFAALDNWYRLFAALTPLTVALIAIVAVLRDEPQGYIQRVALGVLSFTLFGDCLGHLAFLANDRHDRPILLLVFLSVELNDIFAFIAGKTVGRRKLIPKTSPNKTIGGALGALVLTTLLVLVVGRYAFEGTVLANPVHLLVLGLLLSVVGQFGDLMLSSVKRDLGVKDMAATIPGHGGLLDRFDSIILAGPVVFHFVNYFVGVGVDLPTRLFTGG